MRTAILVCAGFAAGFVIRDLLIGILIRPTIKKMLGQCEKCIGKRLCEPEKLGLVDKDETPPRDANALSRALVRRWAACTVKVYDALYREFGEEPFCFDALFESKAWEAMARATDGIAAQKAVTQTFTVLVRADAAKFLDDGSVRLARPTDELRKAVELEAIRLVYETKEVPA